MTPWSPTFAFYTLHTDGFLQNAVSKMKVFIRSILAAAFLALISCAAIQHAKAEEVKDGVRIERDISYVPDGDSSQRLDLYLPEKGSDKPLPLLVWVHGGGWLGGSKKETLVCASPPAVSMPLPASSIGSATRRFFPHRSRIARRRS